MSSRLWLGVTLLTACGAGPLPPSHPEKLPPTCSVPITADDPAYGDSDALVTAVFFGNPTQPETYRTMDEILALTIREGTSRVRAVYKFFPQDAEATRLADTSLSVRSLAGTTAFFQYQRLLLNGFASGAPRPFSNAQLTTWAKTAGLQEPTLPEPNAKNQQELAAHAALARRLGVTETPTLFINGQRTPIQPDGVITESIERELKKSESRLATGLPRKELYAVACAENGGRSVDDVHAVESTLSSGLTMKDLVVGKGREALTGDKITVHYTGMLADGTVFDSSVERGTPFEFTLGRKMVIQGWERGLLGMRVGGKRTLVIPPELGYGTRGQPPRIPPKATLRFEVELLEVKPGDPLPKEPKAPQQ